ncbi:uncharacterized protein [Miscanthus floridulus]|uniref:uncharacterized protein n=1 Tax=Miscanthus floridulus TaxID=154761 RepID=UPI00345859B1
MASTSATYQTARSPAAQIVHPDEIWEEIFLRLDAATDLAQVSAACSSFRRIVSTLCFLHRLRSLRSPAVLGFISSTRYQPFFPVEPPHHSAPEARALEQAADFTFSFLPDPSMWRFSPCPRWPSPPLPAHLHQNPIRGFRSLRSPCGGRAVRRGPLITRRPRRLRRPPPPPPRLCVGPAVTTAPPVCSVRACRSSVSLCLIYVKIPRIPDDLLPFAADNGITRPVLPVLAPAGENDEEESFRVIWTVQHKGKGRVVVFIFSSCNQTWRGK